MPGSTFNTQRNRCLRYNPHALDHHLECAELDPRSEKTEAEAQGIDNVRDRFKVFPDELAYCGRQVARYGYCGIRPLTIPTNPLKE